MSDSYGQSLVLDLIDCKQENFTRSTIEAFCLGVCDLINMEREDLHFWDYEDDEYLTAPDHLKGTSAVQFIRTSSLVIHTLDVSRQVFIDLFSCKSFNHEIVAVYAASFFEGKIHAQHSLTRG